jgi:hypothetical protein
VHYKKE